MSPIVPEVIGNVWAGSSGILGIVGGIRSISLVVPELFGIMGCFIFYLGAFGFLVYFLLGIDRVSSSELFSASATVITGS